MEALTTITLLHMATAPRFADAKAVDQYYQAHDPCNPRVILIDSIVAVIGIISAVVIPVPL